MIILICDDMVSETRELTKLLEAEGHNVIAFNKGADALEYIEDGGYTDACVFDIVMPEMNGMELAVAVRKTGWEGWIIFLSTSSNYGPQSYEVKAFDYLLKPVTPDRVRAMLQKLVDAEKDADKKSLMLKIGGVMRAVRYRDISHVEATRNTVTYHLTDGTRADVYISFHETAEQLLSDSRFAQCHRSFIVNMNEIETIAGLEIVMRVGARVGISKSYAEVKKRYFEYGLRGALR